MSLPPLKPDPNLIGHERGQAQRVRRRQSRNWQRAFKRFRFWGYPSGVDGDVRMANPLMAVREPRQGAFE